ERSAKFIKEAVKRKSKVSERERLYIEAFAAAMIEDPLSDAKQEDREHKYKELLEQIVVKYPNDLEAKSMYVLATMWESGGDLDGRGDSMRETVHADAHDPAVG